MSIIGIVAVIVATFSVSATVALIAYTRQQQDDILTLQAKLKLLEAFVMQDSHLLQLVAQAVADQQKALNESLR